MRIVDGATPHGVLNPEDYLNIHGFISRPAFSKEYYKKNNYNIYMIHNIDGSFTEFLNKNNNWFKLIGGNSVTTGSSLLEVLIQDTYTLAYIKHMMNSPYMVKAE